MSLEQILEKVHEDAMLAKPPKKWRTLSADEAVEAKRILSDIWQASADAPDYQRVSLLYEMEVILHQLGGLDAFHEAWRMSYKYKPIILHEYDLPRPYYQPAMEQANHLLNIYSDNELADAFRNLGKKLISPIDWVSDVSVLKAALYRERETGRSETLKMLLREIVIEGGNGAAAAADILLYEAMRTCDLGEFDNILSQSQAPVSIKRTFWRARMTNSGPASSLNPNLLENQIQALRGYQAILRYGYCADEF